MHLKRAGSAAALAVTVLLLAGACSNTSNDAETGPKPPAQEHSDADPAPGGEGDNEVTYENPFPECAEIWTPEEVQEAAPHFAPEAIVRTNSDSIIGHTPGPAAQQAIREAKRVQECLWGVENSDNVVIAWQAELPDDTLRTFLEELDASDYVREEHDDGLTTYMLDGLDLPGPGCVNCQHTSWYGFAGNLLMGQVPTDEEVPGFILNTVEAMHPNH